jgi:hypothetical protein
VGSPDDDDDDEQTPAQSPSLKSALDSMLSSIFTPLSEAPAVDAERDEFLKKCMEETFLSAGKLDKKRVLKAAGKVGLRPPTGCGPKARGAAFAENVLMRSLTRRSLQPRPLVAVAHPLPPPLPTILNGRLWLHRWR